MVVLRKAQMEALRQQTMAQCEQRLLVAVADTFPSDFEWLGEQGMRPVVRLSIKRAARHGFKTEQQIYLYLSLMLMLGAFFDEDPQLPWIQAQLTKTANVAPSPRIMALHDTTMDYLDSLAGTENQYLIKALVRIRKFDLAEFDADTSPKHTIALLSRLFPEKAALQGEESLYEVFELAKQNAANHNIKSTRGIGLWAGLIFMLGSGFEKDPRFPWAMQVLQNQHNPENTVTELHTRALAFLLQHGLSGQAASEG